MDGNYAGHTFASTEELGAAQALSSFLYLQAILVLHPLLCVQSSTATPAWQTVSNYLIINVLSLAAQIVHLYTHQQPVAPIPKNHMAPVFLPSQTEALTFLANWMLDNNPNKPKLVLPEGAAAAAAEAAARAQQQKQQQQSLNGSK